MEKENDLKGHPVPAGPAGNEKQKSIFSDFVANDSPAVADDAKDKVAKEREYYDAKENPARNYNINDQAFSQSSPSDFIETVSKFRHNSDKLQ